MEFDFLYKVILIGSAKVGKSSLVRRFVENEFIENHGVTIGVEWHTKTIEVMINGITKIVKLQIWDTAGQERHHAMVKQYFRGAHIVLFVFSLDDTSSFDHIDKTWLKEFREVSDKTEYQILIGNKCDLPAAISRDRINTYAMQNAMEYIETSAKTGEKVDELFKKAATELVTREAPGKLIKDDLVIPGEDDDDQPKQKKRDCCGGT